MLFLCGNEFLLLRSKCLSVLIFIGIPFFLCAKNKHTEGTGFTEASYFLPVFSCTFFLVPSSKSSHMLPLTNQYQSKHTVINNIIKVGINSFTHTRLTFVL
jgi:hypothetical protein